MKKMFNKKFFLILGSTITLLIVLSIAMFFLTKENVKTFTKEGYIIASGNKDTSVKYYFDEGTSYKKNINSELVFTDTSGEKVTVETDNFMHYIDGGIKFLKNGVIMDLDNINSSTVPYYNITNKSVLEYSKKSYYIETIDKTLAFNNIVGKISENKYIFAGVNIKLQLAGNDKLIDGDYFEINFIENGIIKAENQEVSYQTTAENSYILVDDIIKIDLGNKKVYYEGEEKMSLSQMTIDGNENIEIIPDEEDKNGTGAGDGEGTGNDDNNQENNNNIEDNPNNNDGKPDENGNEQGNGNGTGTGESSKRNASIDIVKAEVGATNIKASFIINDPDNTIKGDLVLYITNTDTGKRVYSIVVDKTQPELNIDVLTLSPDSNYILSINEESNDKYDTQYFQKLFKTESLGITLEKKYVTQDSIAYEVLFSEDTEVKTAKITLYDEYYQEVASPIIVSADSNLAYFENLTNNKTYNIVLDDVIMNNLAYNDVYSIYKSTKTLKKTPYLEGLSTAVDDVTNAFIVGVDRVVDEDKSITKYSYYIYKADDITQDNIDILEPVKIIEKTDNSKVNIGIDNESILPKTNYKFKIVAEYYDNEKYGEFETELSDNFILSGKPTIDFVIDNEKTSFNKIVGTIVLNDDNCTVPIYGRSCSSVKLHNNNFVLEYKIINSTEKLVKNITFNASSLESSIEIDNLIANTEYVFNLYGDVDLLDGKGLREGYLIGTFRASTSSVDILTVDTWKQNESTRENLINVSAKIISSGENQNLGDSIHNITFNLYAGDTINQLKAGVNIDSIATKQESGNLKETYYNKLFTIDTFNTFGFTNQTITDEETGEVSTVLALDLLKSKTDDKLQRYYTIEITDIFDEGFQNEIQIENNYFLFETPPLLLMEDQLEMPSIVVDPIQNISLKGNDELKQLFGIKYTENLADTSIVGFKVNTSVNVPSISDWINKISTYFPGGQPVKELIYYVCDADTNKKCDIDGAVETKTVDLSETLDLELPFVVKTGTKYGVTDNSLTRGHNYIFKLKFNIDTDNDGVADTYFPNDEVASDTIKVEKNSPRYSAYILSSTDNKINYKFEFTDVDNALYERVIYYTIDDELKNTVDVPESNGEDETDETTQETQDEDTETPKNEVKSIELNNCSEKKNSSTGLIDVECEFELDGLSNNSVYSLSFKKALIKKSSSVTDVKIGQYIFDGKYTYNSNTVTYSNIVNENDNKLKIKINETDSNKKYVNRISAYEIVLSASGLDDYTRVYPSNSIKTCTEGEVSYKCIIVDYADIKDFKTKDISVKVSAYYDSGIINNDFSSNTLSTVNDIGYILQVNNVYNKQFTRAKYIHFTKQEGSNVYISTTDYPSGIYGYGETKKNKINIIRKINLSKYVFATEEEANVFTPTLVYYDDLIGLYNGSKYTGINNKLLSKIDLGTTDNTFKFNSIIPKITVTTKGLVNGSVITIKPSGVDTDILKNEFKAEDDGKYYFYLSIYKDKEKTELYKEVKAEINLENGTVVELTKYMPNTTYYFDVSAYLKKENDNDFKKTLLFDSAVSNDYITRVYSFNTLAPESIAYNQSIPTANYKSESIIEDNIYLKRSLVLTLNSKKDIGIFKTRFEIYDINDNLILTKTVDPVKEPLKGNYYISEAIEDITPDLDNTSKHNYLFGSGYYSMKVYIETEVFENDDAPDGQAEMLIYESPITLRKLSDPSYSVERSSSVNSLTFSIKVDDPDKIIVANSSNGNDDGEYCVVLLDSAQNPINGQAPKCGYSALEWPMTVTYTGLSPDTVYNFRVYADVYANNISDSVKNREVKSDVLISTVKNYGVALGSVAVNASPKKGITLTFGSGVNVSNIKEYVYTLMEIGENGTAGKQVATSGKYPITASFNVIDNYTVELNFMPKDSDGNEVTLTSGRSYYLVMQFYVPDESGNLVLLDSEKKFENTIKVD